jgi:hypothetical protein
MKYIIKKVVEVKSIDELMHLENKKGVLEIEIAPYNVSMNQVRGLTEKQKKLFEFIIFYQRKHSKSPTLDSIRIHLGVKSINTAVGHLQALEKKGFITKYKGNKRNIKINRF